MPQRLPEFPRDAGLLPHAGAKAAKAEPKAKWKKPAKATKPADGTPCPKAVSELFNV